MYRREFLQSGPSETCYYCGNLADTKDHIPSKVLLDYPYPDDLETVPCCRKCNNQFSKDEEYFAVLIECFKQQSTELGDLKRSKVQEILKHTPSLLQTVKKFMEYDLFGHLHISPNDRRLNNVILKLVRAHLRNENGIVPTDDDIIKINITTLEAMSPQQYERFFMPQRVDKLPEVCCKALYSILILDNTAYNFWHIYQDNTSAYFVSIFGDEVKILIQNFLAIQATIESDINQM